MENQNPTLHCKLGNSIWSFELMDNYLVRRWEQVRGPNKGEEYIALATLCPHLTVQSGRAKVFEGRSALACRRIPSVLGRILDHLQNPKDLPRPNVDRRAFAGWPGYWSLDA